MTHYSCTAALGLLFTGKLRQCGATNRDSQDTSEIRPTGNGLPSSLIHHLDDDSLLIIFSLCRPVILDKNEVDNVELMEGGDRSRERWWPGLIQVCRRWRYLVLESAFHLQVTLVCARGTPVADMLANSPPLPLIIDHCDEHQDLSAEDEEGIVLALQHRDRVRRIRLLKPIPILQKLIIALEREFPNLEFLLIEHQRYHKPVIEHITNLDFPETFRAPNLRQLVIENFATPIESPILTTMGNLISLVLIKIPSSVYFHPNALLQRLSLMPQLETLDIHFNWYSPSRDDEGQLLRTPIIMQVALPYLRSFGFRGACAYLEALLPWLAIPLIETLQVCFFNRMIYYIPHLQQFMSTAQILRFNTAEFLFCDDCLHLAAYPRMEARLYTLSMDLGGIHLDWQVASAARVFHSLRTKFSAVEHLYLEYDRHNISSEWNNEADLTHWRELLGTFSKVKTLFVDGELVGQLSRALQPGEGEPSSELLPELRELSHSSRRAQRNAFTRFVRARRKAGHSVTVIRR